MRLFGNSPRGPRARAGPPEGSDPGRRSQLVDVAGGDGPGGGHRPRPVDARLERAAVDEGRLMDAASFGRVKPFHSTRVKAFRLTRVRPFHSALVVVALVACGQEKPVEAPVVDVAVS